MIPCICIDDSNKPDVIPKERWVVKGNPYHITHLQFHSKQGNIQGVLLYEVSLNESCLPYETYGLSRFAVHIDDFQKLVELAQACSELNNVDVLKALEESSLELVKN